MREAWICRHSFAAFGAQRDIIAFHPLYSTSQNLFKFVKQKKKKQDMPFESEGINVWFSTY
jgi:hypothetical protein